ncbi:hypothetical protein NQ317_000268 [Molorchus minor]|uniref:Carbohydrate kinase FGGY C-terminal domain-containing protein n=1 Tax=Molorchus minor TaxID=1323400 RepID=A0ABQ9J2J7_9CUCU|nr:hypothetical protein NQ317_000268 [Molorchus minor]
MFPGISIKWLRDNLQIIKDVAESSEIAQSVDESGEVYFVPAFSGLYAPYWRKDARRSSISKLCQSYTTGWKQEIFRMCPGLVSPPNVSQARPIETFMAQLTQKVYDKGWAAQNQQELPHPIFPENIFFNSVLCGLTEETKPGHIVKAALEAVCYQVRDVLESILLDCDFPLTKLLVDGGMTSNDYLMQMQADYCGIPVVRPTMLETTALGAAIAAGTAKGIGVWEIENIEPVPSDVFVPSISENVRDVKYSRWKMAIKRSFGWSCK